jgi:hypothetical protein
MHMQIPMSCNMLATLQEYFWRWPPGGRRHQQQGSCARQGEGPPPTVFEPSQQLHSDALRVGSAVLQIKLPEDLQDAARSSGNHRLVQAGDHAGACQGGQSLLL